MIPFRRFQFSLSTIFVVMTLLAVSCGIVVELERERVIHEHERERLISVLTRRIPPSSMKEIKIKPMIP